MRRFKREKVLSRRQRLQAISRELEKSMSLDIASLTDEEKSKFYNLESDLEDLHSEIDHWRSGMEGTNLEYTMKYGTLEECQEQLEQLRDMMSYFVSDFKKNINITNNDWEEFEFIAENIVWAGMF
jgi:chromosome segregation ATPase